MRLITLLFCVLPRALAFHFANSVIRHGASYRSVSFLASSRSGDDFWDSCSELKNDDVYNRGVTVEVPDANGGVATGVAWRQNAQVVELWVPIDEKVRVKKDVKCEITRSKLSLSVPPGVDLERLELCHPVDADESSWTVEYDDVPVDTDRWLVVSLYKRDTYLNWDNVFAGVETTRTEGPPGSLRIGGGQDQKAITAQQLASYQRLSSMVGCHKSDVYVRRRQAGGAEEGSGGRGDGAPVSPCYFLGKVVALVEVDMEEALLAQGPLIKEHARRLLPDEMGTAAEEELELLYAPGDTEMDVAQNKADLTPCAETRAGASKAEASKGPRSVAEVGYEPETLAPDQRPFKTLRAADGAVVGEAFDANFQAPERASEFR